MRLCIAIYGLLLASSAMAQNASLQGWTKSEGQNGIIVFTSSNRDATIMISGWVESTAPLDPHAQETALGLSKNVPGCDGLGQSMKKMDKIAAWATTGASNAYSCRLIVLQGAGRYRNIMSVAINPSKAIDAEADRFAGLYADNIGGAEYSTSPKTPVTGNVDDALKRAASAIPSANKPVGAVTYGTGSYSGWPPSYIYRVTTRFLFGNSMSATCSDWDPGQFAPTKSSPVFSQAGCRLLPWRKLKGVVEFQKDDGTWSSTDSGDGVFGFKPGERIDISFGNVGATGFDFGAGSVRTGTISGGDLRMTADGRIAAGDWSTTVVSGGGIGGGSSSESGPKVGRYYLDGHIIIVADENGAISRGFIGAVSDGPHKRIGHIYLNGKHYWDRSD